MTDQPKPTREEVALIEVGTGRLGEAREETETRVRAGFAVPLVSAHTLAALFGAGHGIDLLPASAIVAHTIAGRRGAL